MNWQELITFIFVFIAISLLGFFAVRWRPGNLNRLQEWGLAGRRFGAVITWFLVGGDLYTAYSFLSVPALVFAQGAIGFFAVPYTILTYPVMYLIAPRFWNIARHRGYVTSADFVQERFDSKILALAVAITGILATMPYMALQVYGIQICLSLMGIPVELSLLIAFAILAAYTYTSGIRGTTLVSIAKDVCIWITILIALIVLTTKLGGMAHIFASIPQKKALLLPTQYSAYSTLALGSALALPLYPHAFTAFLSANSSKVVKKTVAPLYAYSFLLGMIALLGIMAGAAHIIPSPVYKTNIALPGLLTLLFPSWLTGFAFAAIAIGALVPAGVMSIAAANLFTRNIYRAYLNPNCTEKEETSVARITSLVVKIGGLAFILFLPTPFSINFQLLSTIWILQTLPAIYLGLYTNWFHRWGVLVGWFCGMVVGTTCIVALNFQSSVYPLALFGAKFPLNAALIGLVVNLLVAVTLTLVLRQLGVVTGEDNTIPQDYEARPVLASMLAVTAATVAPDTATITPVFNTPLLASTGMPTPLQVSRPASPPSSRQNPQPPLPTRPATSRPGYTPSPSSIPPSQSFIPVAPATPPVVGAPTFPRRPQRVTMTPASNPNNGAKNQHNGNGTDSAANEPAGPPWAPKH